MTDKKAAPSNRTTASGNPNGLRRSNNAQDLAIRRYRALDLRIKGQTYRAIAKTLGINQSTLLHDIDVCLREREAGNILRLRQLEEERLDVALAAAMDVLAKGKGTELALKAVDRIIRVSGRRSNLLGLDAPVELNINTTEKTQADLELEELLREAEAHAEITRQQLMEQAAGDPDPAN